MQGLDLFFVILLGLLTVRGFLKGFTGEFFSVASVALALIAAVLFFKNGADFIRLRYMQMPILPEIIAFVVIFIIVFISGKLLGRIVQDIVNRLSLTVVDKVLGIILGLAEGFAVMVFILFIISIQPLFNPNPLIEQSFFARLLIPLIGVINV